MDESTTKNRSPVCPFCGCNKIYRSRRHGTHEWFLHYFRFTSPYRCQDCDGRFFRSRRPDSSKKELHHHPA